MRDRSTGAESSAKTVKGGIFTPALQLMNRLTYPVKFTLISILLTIPSVVLIVLLTQIRNEAIDFGFKEHLGVEYSVPVKTMMMRVLEHRTLTKFALKGDAPARLKLAELQQKIAMDIKAIDEVDAKLGGKDILDATDFWKAAKEAWTKVGRNPQPNEREKSDAEHNLAALKLLELLSRVGDTSNLILDPDIDSYYIMDGVLLKLPYLATDIAAARDLGVDAAQGVALPPDRRARLIFGLPDIIDSRTGEMTLGMQKAYTYKNINAAAPGVKERVGKDYDAAAAAIAAFVGTTRTLNTVEIDSTFNFKAHFEKAEKALLELNTLFDSQYRLLDDLILVRIEAFRSQRLLIQIIVPIILLLVVYLLVGFYRSVMRTVQNLEDISQKLVSGDTTEKVELEAKDELASVGEAFNTIGQALVEKNKQLEKTKTEIEKNLMLLDDSYKKLEQTTSQVQEQQSQLIQAEKMSSLGQMVAGIAHEVNTPLGFVRNNVEVIEKNQKKLFGLIAQYRDLRDSLINGNLDDLESKLINVSTASEKIDDNRFVKKNEDIISESLSGLDRIQELVLNLKDFSRLDEAAFKLSDLNKGIDSTLNIANNVLKHKVNIERDYADNMMVECFASRLNQVFLNLITNAAQAIEKEGVIRIRTYKESASANGTGGKESAVIYIADNGSGMTPEVMKRIFEPFYTTKPVGQGTGLGLSIVYKIIEQHKGTIEVKSVVGKGTEFIIKIPVQQMKSGASQQAPEAVGAMS